MKKNYTSFIDVKRVPEYKYAKYHLINTNVDFKIADLMVSIMLKYGQ